MFKSLADAQEALSQAAHEMEPEFDDKFEEITVVIEYCDSTADRTTLTGRIDTPVGRTTFEMVARHRIQGPIDVHTSLRGADGLWFEDLHRQIRVSFDEQFTANVVQCMAEHILVLCECVVPGSIFDKRFRK